MRLAFMMCVTSVLEIPVRPSVYHHHHHLSIYCGDAPCVKPWDAVSTHVFAHPYIPFLAFPTQTCRAARSTTNARKGEQKNRKEK
ncbi:hypothetical protein VTH06DRAFT_4713 [Thermothelomyces fergusii]